MPGGETVIPQINRIAENFGNVVLTQDWHPRDHISFAPQHPAKKPYDTITLPYGEQVLWPDHCVQGTAGAAFYDALSITHAGLIVRKGMYREIDSYSALYENDRSPPTGSIGYLRERGLNRIFLAGLAFDFCVRYSAEDARRAGFDVVVIRSACRAIDVNGSAIATEKSFKALEISCLEDL